MAAEKSKREKQREYYLKHKAKTKATQELSKQAISANPDLLETLRYVIAHQKSTDSKAQTAIVLIHATQVEIQQLRAAVEALLRLVQTTLALDVEERGKTEVVDWEALQQTNHAYKPPHA